MKVMVIFMRRSKLTLKMQLSLLFIGVLTVLILLMIFFINKNVLNIITKNTEISRLSSFSRIDSEMGTLEKDMTKIMQYILFNPQVEDFCTQSPDVDAAGVLLRKDIGDSLDKLLTVYPEIHSLFLYTSNGDSIGTEGAFNYNSTGESFDWGNVTYNTVSWESNEKLSNIGQNKSKHRVIALSSFFKYRNCVVKITVNLKEPSFYNVYEPFSESKLSNIYLCDNNGIVMSAGSPSFFEKALPYAEQLQGVQQEGSFVNRVGNEEKQIIYKRLKNTNWLVVEEIPLSQYMRDMNTLKQSLSIILLISVVCAAALSVFFIRKAMAPFKLLTTAMSKMQQGNIGYQITDSYPNEFGEIISCFNSMSCNIFELVENNKRIEQQKTQYAIAVLKAQINPHFLFNTINMIKWMAIAQNSDSITRALEMLLALLKPIFKKNLTYTTLSEELDYLQNYIKLINLRFGGEIQLVTELPPEMMELEIPQFILQPIIENCIEHGFRANSSNGLITIRCLTEEKPILIISDTGQGMSAQALAALREQLLVKETLVENGDKIGIANVHLRLKLMLGDDCGLDIQSQEGAGTTVTVRL